MGIRSYVRDRKQVNASRATDSGQPDWDTPTHTVGSPSNKELMDRKKPRKLGNYDSVNSSGSSSSLEPAAQKDPHRYRLQTGDD
jgi:hypothetical protein